MQLFVRGNEPASHHGKHLRLGNAELLLEGLDRHARFVLLDVSCHLPCHCRIKVMHGVFAKQCCLLSSALAFYLPLMYNEK